MKVSVELNQQQEQLIASLIAEGDVGADAAGVIRHGLREFCRQHPELVRERDGDG